MMATSITGAERLRFMTKDPSKIKRCPACKRLADAATMRPLSRSDQSGVRFVCLDCFTEGMAQQKSAAATRKKPA